MKPLMVEPSSGISFPSLHSLLHEPPIPSPPPSRLQPRQGGGESSAAVASSPWARWGERLVWGGVADFCSLGSPAAQSPTAADPLQQAYAGVQQYAGR